MICSVNWVSTGTGLQSFAFPFTGRIQSVTAWSNQTGTALVSTNGAQVPAAGVAGSERGLIASLASAGTDITVDFPIDQGQLVFIDVKVAATFNFTVLVKG